ncbi:MAG: hypothetical protein JWQ89_375, partial [Devosia sp.]|nr:hypothetical protein [Devosia sp.]
PSANHRTTPSLDTSLKGEGCDKGAAGAQG